jgi:hypothetical protein
MEKQCKWKEGQYCCRHAPFVYANPDMIVESRRIQYERDTGHSPPMTRTDYPHAMCRCGDYEERKNGQNHT